MYLAPRSHTRLNWSNASTPSTVVSIPSASERPMIAVMILALFLSCWVHESTKLLSTLSLSNGAERK
ncbi:hypothetical protein D3C83_185070 [compost metagenome]